MSPTFDQPYQYLTFMSPLSIDRATALGKFIASNANNHPEANNVRERLTAQVNAYFRGYRGILGLAYLELLAV